MYGLLGIGAVLVSASWGAAGDEQVEEGFVSLWDGTSLEGWTISENQDSWSIQDGAIVAKGERSHLFYTGELAPFKNFELRVDCKTEANSNGGIYFHTQFQETGWPKFGYETQVNNSHKDPKRTGSLYAVSNVLKQHIPDGQWWTQTILVEGNHVQIKLDDEVVVDFYEPPGVGAASPDFERRLGEGTFALQAHDPGSTVYFRNIRVRKLP
jgi:hypothetical protein